MTLNVKVIPGSAKTEFAGEMSDGTIKIRIAAPADKGKANEELRAFLAAHYKIPKSSVKIMSGHTSPRKLIKIQNTAK